MKTILFSCFIVGSILMSNVFAQSTTAFVNEYTQSSTFFNLPGNITEGTTQGKYILAGTDVSIALLRGNINQLSSSGTVDWSYKYTDASVAFQINDVKTDHANNQYYLVGGRESSSSDGVFFIVDATGNVVLSRKFKINEADGAYFNKVIKTSDGGYAIVGYVINHKPGGGEINFNTQTWTDSEGNSVSQAINSPLIVKLNSNGNYVWHKVFRYYKTSSKNPNDAIYNSAEFSDIVELNDGYVTVGSYKVNNHGTVMNSDQDADATPRDALILKTTTSGNITYHKQVDNPSTSGSQNSKYLTAVNKTAAGDIIAVGTDKNVEMIQKYSGAGGFSNIFSRNFKYTTPNPIPLLPAITNPVDPSVIYEVAGGTDLVTMSMNIGILGVEFSTVIHKVNSTATSNIWAKKYTNGIGSFLPVGSQASDNGHLAASMTGSIVTGQFEYVVIKTDPNGVTPSNCSLSNITPNPESGPTTFADPYYKSFAGTPGSNSLSVVRISTSLNTSSECKIIICTPPPTPIIHTDGATCKDPSTSSITNYDPTMTYVFVPSGPSVNSNGDIIGTVTGTTYTVTAVDADDCESAGATFVNEKLPTPDAPTVSTTSASCSGNGTGTITNYNSSYTYTFTPSGPTVGSGGVINGAIAGTTYVVAATNQEGCTSEGQNFLINPQFDTPVAPTISTTNATCTSDGISTITNYNSSYTYTFTPSGPSVGSGGVITGANAGTTYTVTATNGDGCQSTSTSFINGAQVAAPASPTVSTTAASCTSDGTTTITNYDSNFTYTFTPSGPSVGSGGVVSGAIPGTSYTVTATNSSGCASTGTTFTNPAQLAVPSFTITVSNPTNCGGNGTIYFNFTDVPNGTYTIYYDGGQFTNVTVTNGQASVSVPAGGYTNININNGGCTSTVTVNAVLVDPDAPNAPSITTTPASCSSEGSSIINGYNSGLTYTFTPAGPSIGSGGVITGANPGVTYNVTITENGCTSASTTFLNEAQYPTPDAPQVNVVGATCEADGSATITNYDNSNTYTFISSGPTIGSGGTITNVNYGQQYTVTTTNSEGCTSSSTTFTIEGQYEAPAITINASATEICTGDQVDLNATGGDNYSWDNGLGSGASHTVTPSSSTTYTVTGVDANGCEGTASIFIDVHETPNISAGEDAEICMGESINIIATGGNTYSWDNGLGSGAAHSVSPTETTTYTVTGADNIGCENSASITITVHELPEIETSLTHDNFCSGGTTVISASGNANTYTWDNGVGSGQTHEVSPAVTTTYTVTGTDVNGCVSTASITVTVLPLPNVVASAESEDICLGESTVISASGANDYVWDGLGTEVSYTVTPTSTGEIEYTVTGTDGNDCENTSTIVITVHDAPTINAGEDLTICLGDEIIITAEGGHTYSWDNDLGEGASHVVSPTEETEYIVIGADPYGCENSDTLKVFVNPLPEVSIKEEYTICLGSGITFEIEDADDSYNYTWYFNEEEIGEGASYTIDLTVQSDEGEYLLVVENEYGCHTYIEINLIIKVCDIDVMEVISPNGDGLNDYFYIEHLEAYPNTEVWIYNRWGEEVYHNEDYKNDWNGTSESKLNIGGNELPEGTYYYILKLGGNDTIPNSGEILKGFVYLKR